MATYRIGIGTEFKLDGGVGIGTDTAPSGLGNLKVEGTFKTEDLDTTSGIATFTRYAGFAPDNLGIDKDTTLTGEHQTTSDIVVGVNSTFTVSVAATVCTSSVESISLTDHFSPPCGYVEDREECPVEGTVRFNKDLNTLEFYNGVDWRQFTVNGSSTRAVVGAGYISPEATYYEDLEYFSISSGGSTISFGNLSSSGGGRSGASFGSSTRGMFATGYGDTPGSTGHNIIDYITIASVGNAIDFGDATDKGYNNDGCSSSTRGVFNLGYIAASPVYNNVMDYVEIATVGNALDFGDLSAIGGWNSAVASPTRGLFGGFYPRNNGSIDRITIASKGNAVEFGNLFTHYGQGACSNSVRAIFAGGTNYPSPGYGLAIQSVIIASDGNAVDFGESYNGAMLYVGRGVASQTRGCITGGSNAIAPATVDEVTTIQYIDFDSGGKAIAFGDMSIPRRNHRGVSDSHGGLGGY